MEKVITESPAFGHVPSILWRSFCDDLYQSRFSAWLDRRNFTRVLKTDLYDESITDGLYPFLLKRAQHIYGIDELPVVVNGAASKHPGLHSQVADVRNLPFSDKFFDLLVSNSTLDHFERLDDILVSLRELYRVLQPGGILLITLDNAHHPLIWLRRKLALLLGSPLPLVPYYPGHTLTLTGLTTHLQVCGFEVIKTGYWFHALRVVTVPLCNWLERYCSGWSRALHSWLVFFEIFERLPTAFLTGHYVAVMARRRN